MTTKKNEKEPTRDKEGMNELLFYVLFRLGIVVIFIAFCATLATMCPGCAKSAIIVVPDIPARYDWPVAPHVRQTVILLPDDHLSHRCQASLYSTMERLVLTDGVRVLAREGRWTPTEHDNRDFATMRYVSWEGDVSRYRDFLALPLEERRLEIVPWFTLQSNWPYQYSAHGPGHKGPPVIASVMIEAVFQGKVRTVGIEDEAAWKRAAETLDDGDVSGDELPLIMERREEWFVVNLIKLLTENSFDDTVMFPIGGDHVDRLIIALNSEKINVTVLRHDTCDEL